MQAVRHASYQWLPYQSVKAAFSLIPMGAAPCRAAQLALAFGAHVEKLLVLVLVGEQTGLRGQVTAGPQGTAFLAMLASLASLVRHPKQWSWQATCCTPLICHAMHAGVADAPTLARLWH